VCITADNDYDLEEQQNTEFLQIIQIYQSLYNYYIQDYYKWHVSKKHGPELLVLIN
jgi:hypothetical protein